MLYLITDEQNTEEGPQGRPDVDSINPDWITHQADGEWLVTNTFSRTYKWAVS